MIFNIRGNIRITYFARHVSIHPSHHRIYCVLLSFYSVKYKFESANNDDDDDDDDGGGGGC